MKIYVSEALARSRNISTYIFCWYIAGSCPPQYQKAGYATDIHGVDMEDILRIYIVSGSIHNGESPPETIDYPLRLCR